MPRIPALVIATHMPPTKGLPPLRHWPRIVWMAVRAIFALLQARMSLRRITVRDINQGNLASANAATAAPDPVKVAWVAYVIQRVARRMPFRSDCLVQALAAQNFLKYHAIASTIVIGAAIEEGKPFSAHAWLTCGETVVTGGDIAPYTVLV